MSKNKNVSESSSSGSEKGANFGFVFGPKNYRLMLIGLAVIVLGFVLMYGTEDIYDARKTTIAPIVVLTGFVIEIFAIMTKSDSANGGN